MKTNKRGGLKEETKSSPGAGVNLLGGEKKPINLKGGNGVGKNLEKRKVQRHLFGSKKKSFYN